MQPNLKPSDRATVAGLINPDPGAPATFTSGWISVAEYYWLMAMIFVGAMTATATLNAKLEQATDDAGSDAKDVTGSAITALTAAGVDDNKAVLINFEMNKIDRDNDFTHVRLSITTGVAAAVLSGCVLGFDPRYGVHEHIEAVDEVVDVI